MENTTHLIRFIILNDENEVLKNFILTERKYGTPEEAAEAAQTVCCVLMNHCGWNVFYRIVRPTVVGETSFHEKTADGSIVSDDELHEEEEEEEENCSFDEIEDEDIDKFLAWMHAYCQEKDE